MPFNASPPLFTSSHSRDDVSRDLCFRKRRRSPARSTAVCHGVQLKVLLYRLKTMVRVCAYPNCKSRMSRNTPYSFYRLPLSEGKMLKLWLTVLQLDANSCPDTAPCAADTFPKMTTASSRRDYTGDLSRTVAKRTLLMYKLLPDVIAPLSFRGFRLHPPPLILNQF